MFIIFAIQMQWWLYLENKCLLFIVHKTKQTLIQNDM